MRRPLPISSAWPQAAVVYPNPRRLAAEAEVPAQLFAVGVGATAD